jgi:hypothetical protein
MDYNSTQDTVILNLKLSLVCRKSSMLSVTTAWYILRLQKDDPDMEDSCEYIEQTVINS